MYVKSLFTDLNASIKKVELEELEKGNIYPVTVVMDRYQGTYSNAQWLAFNFDPSEVPEEIGGDDPTETIFWREHDDKKLPIGKGNTPDEAIADLKAKVKRYYENW
jgi:bifunctional DNase/RNase